VSKIACITEGAYTYEMTDTYRHGICSQYGAGEFKMTVNGKPVTLSSSRHFRDVVRESFFVVERGTGSTADYRLDAWMPPTMRSCMRLAGRYITTLLLLPLLAFTNEASLVICRRSLFVSCLAASTSL
jgi:hypothetical protein